ncbi:hypothetical protein [Demequina lignilytica]|uniref:Uncharacterized protein n=1 Tax=Demequina lignilytica TaxID=3051663 RepID=A0AB35MIL5_9MICO|nr:hypothetical protein [Demequina sp. SYSU T0a273]MDN4483624.1 hypothetical protein [Demequina sp. SYSU T0a273]
MSDEEALARAEHPATGEVWLDEPVEVEPPVGIDLTYLENAEWYHVGDRGSAAILVMDDFMTDVIVEVDADGTVWEVTAPWPHAQAGVASTLGLPVSDAYYDSLAVPHRWSSTDDVSLDLRPEFLGSWDAPSESWGPSTPVATVGTSQVVRTTDGGSGAELMASGPLGPTTKAAVDQAIGGRVEDVAYGLRLPFGFVAHLPAGAVPALDDGAATLTSADDAGYVSLLDQRCGDSPDWRSFGTDEDPAGWEPIDATDVTDLYRATASNPLTAAFHAARVDMAEQGYGDPADTELTVDDYAALPAIIGTPAPDGSGWWIEIRSDLSLRYGC